MRFQTSTSPHHTTNNSVGRVMRQVLYALAPGTLAMIWYFGSGVLFQILIAIVVALASEAAMLAARGRPMQPFLGDYSAVATAWLLALALPPLAPWWVAATGAAFAIIIAKHIYGGLGYNPFNPAMVGYAVVLVSFPSEMTLWPPPAPLAGEDLHLLQTLSVILTGNLPHGMHWDTLTMATPLDAMRTGRDMMRTVEEIRASPLWGDFGGKGWEWVANWYFVGGMWLLYKRIITWRIPVTMLGSLLITAGLAYIADPGSHPFPAFHVFSGGAMLGAFFIATDPVTASATPVGKLIYGAGIGVLNFVIRAWGGYPDGVAFAVLLMNMAVPTIDRYTKPPAFGQRAERDIN
jgi:Na+-translocating ferredoxin:NAD+ oxidoreductase subunit D